MPQISIKIQAAFFAFLIAITAWVIPSLTMAANDTAIISVFTADNCKHCQDLQAFLDEQQATDSKLSVKYYNLADEYNLNLFEQFANKYDLIKATPIILINNEVLQGFESGQTTGQSILNILAKNPAPSNFEEFMANHATLTDNQSSDVCQLDERCENEENTLLNLPFIGQINPADYSMPILTIILGFIDGFNPCAMWVLIMFITLILQAKTKRKMWDMVIIFLVAEAVMYYLILNFWYKTWNFVQLDQYITPVIGLISVGAAIFFLWEFFTAKGECKIIDADTKKKTVSRIQELVNSPLTIGTFFGAIMLAFSINIIEFACSIGIPQAFTKILDLNQYSFLFRQFYIILYTIFYMADDVIIFIIALYGIQYLGLTTKYSRYCQLIGGLLMLLLGYFLIFNPTALKF